MQNIFDIHDFDEHFIDQFTTQTLPIFDRWMIKPLQNEKKILTSGSSEESDKFAEFMNEHSEKDYPHPLLIVVGITEKSNPTKMLNSTLQYHKLKFDKYKGNEIGTPLQFGYNQNNQNNNQMMPLQMRGFGPKPNNAQANQGISFSDIQGIVDKNVSDATRSIKAEYDEVSAKREVDSIKRLAELEMKMELYKLDLRAKEVEGKEKKLQDEQEDFEMEKSEGMGTVKDYTKTIAGGLLELGKVALGLDDDKDDKKDKSKKDKKNNKDSKTDDNLKGTQTSSIDDDGFTEKTDTAEENKENTQKESIKDLQDVVGDLSEEEKMALLDVLIPEDENNEEDNKSDTSTNSTQEKEENQNNDNLKTEKDENIQTDNNN